MADSPPCSPTGKFDAPTTAGGRNVRSIDPPAARRRRGARARRLRRRRRPRGAPAPSRCLGARHAWGPAWFRRTPTTPRPGAEGDVVVYVDQSRLGGPETLRTVQGNAAVVIRHYSASEAEARFGCAVVADD